MKFKLKAGGALCSVVGPGAAVTCNIVAAIRSFVWNCSKAPETPSSCLVAYETLSEGVQHTEDIFYVSVFFLQLMTMKLTTNLALAATTMTRSEMVNQGNNSCYSAFLVSHWMG